MKSILLSVAAVISLFSLPAQPNPLSVSLQAPELNKSMHQLTGQSAQTTQIVMRCGPTIDYNNQPLFIIDGIPWEASSIKSLDPNDIDEIHVLKVSDATSLFSFRATNGVIIITTKKVLDRKFVIRDGLNLAGISSATVKAISEKNNRQFQFTADEFGRIETDSLKSLDYTLTISSTGYKTKTITLKNILQNKGEITLEREYIELKELLIMAYPTISCRSMSSTCSVSSLCGQIRCLAYGVSITEEKQTVKRSFVTKAEAQIYPNPVAATGTINITFPNAMPGLYQIRILNASGQLFYTAQKNIVKAETEQIQLSSRFIPGFYVVQIVNEKKQLLHSSKLLVR